MQKHPLLRVAQLTFEKYQRDDVGSMAAALAYFTIFSIFPLLLVTISLIGFFVNAASFNVQQQILTQVGSPEVRALIIQTLTQFSESRVNAGLLGFGTLFLGATGIFGALDRAFDVIWEARGKPGPGGLRATLTTLLVDRLIAFGLLLGCAGLILLSSLANFALGLLSAYTTWLPQGNLLLRLGQPLITLALITLALAVLYRVLPTQHAAWRDVWPAAFVAALLLAALQALAGLIFSMIDFSSYGAVGGGMTLLLWIFFCGQVILIGGEISFAWAHVLGSKTELPGG
jgi:membrane protein